MHQILSRTLFTGLKRFCSSSYPLVRNELSKFVPAPVTFVRSLSSAFQPTKYIPVSHNLLQNPKVKCLTNNIQTRSVIKFSMMKGKRKSVKDVPKRFYRLRWGIWIRTIAGRHKHLWKKSARRKKRYMQHVFCNATQSLLLDKMAGKYWRKPRFYVDDPYEPYHVREEFDRTSRKPRPYFPPEKENVKN